MTTTRAGLSASAVNGKIYAIGGGLSWGGTCVSAVEEYDPATDTWTTKSDMPTARANLSTCVVNGKIYAIGGATGPTEIFSIVEEYDPATDTWTTKANMPTARNFPSACVLNGKIYVIGGAFSQQGLTSIVEIYDPGTNTWSDTISDMQTVRAGFATSIVNGRIYAFGGIPNMLAAPLSTIEEFDPETDIWTFKSDMPTGRLFLTSTSVNNKIYIIGGTVNDVSNIVLTDQVEEYDPELDIELPNSVEILKNTKPTAFMLYQNYPNPFSSATTIRFKLFAPGYVMLSVYDMLGHEIQVLANGYLTQGEHKVTFDAKNYAKGVYYCKIQAYSEYGNNTVEINKLLLSK
jgi:N-acetylneuraminic acid mutarotase